MAPRNKAKAIPHPEPEMLTIYGDILQETDDAILVRCASDDVWLPKSQIEYSGTRGDIHVPITIPDWLAEEKALSDNQGFISEQSSAAEGSTDAGDAQAEGEEQATEPDIITLYGTITEDIEGAESITFIVHYGDVEGTTSEFTISRSAIVSMEKDEDYTEDDGRWNIKVPVPFAVAAGIIDDPRVDAEDTQADEQEEQQTAPRMDSTPEILRKHPDLKWLAEESITVSQKLTESEKAEYAEEMAKLDGEIEELEDELDGIRKSFKKRIDAAESQRRSAAKIVREGKEEREIFCDKVGDYDTCEIKWADAVTGEVVQTRRMTSEERQLPLPMEAIGGRKKAEVPCDEPTAEADAVASVEPEEGQAEAAAPESGGAESEGMDSDADAALYAADEQEATDEAEAEANQGEIPTGFIPGMNAAPEAHVAEAV